MEIESPDTDTTEIAVTVSTDSKQPTGNTPSSYSGSLERSIAPTPPIYTLTDESSQGSDVSGISDRSPVTAPNGVTTQQGQPVPGSSASSRPTDPSGRVVFYDSPTSSKHSSSSEESSQRTGWINMSTAPISPPHYVVQLYPRRASEPGIVGIPIPVPN